MENRKEGGLQGFEAITEEELMAKRQGWWPFWQAMKFLETRYDDFPSDRAYMRGLSASVKAFVNLSPEDFKKEEDYLNEIRKAGLQYMRMEISRGK